MLKGITVAELRQRVLDEAKSKKDLIADTREARMLAKVVEDGTRLVMQVADQGEYFFQPLAHNQLGSRLDIPAKYYDRMLSADPELLATNVNSWMVRKPERRMFRTLGGGLRAVLSDRYQRIDNHEIAAVALPILEAIPDVKIVSCAVTDHHMYIQAVSPRVQGEVKKGDVVQAGVVIRNSEVGSGAASVAEMDYRLRCLNGAISAVAFRAYHVGRRIEDNADLWKDDTRKADDRAVLLKIRDMVTSAVDAVKFRARLDKMQALAEGRIVGNPIKAVEVLSNTIGTSETEMGGILRSLIDTGDLTAWGMLNAVTAQAHTANDYERSVAFQTIGGDLLRMNNDNWKEILEAA